ncbi:MAG: nitrilase-related carbon-nitrogen hydrolase [Planctomycetota bacterium]|nr:nitrilase-related carbon-nitrogen hydrolase [Planctomycetota bacterium]
MRIHLVQHDIAWEQAAQNRAHVSELLATATLAPGDLVVLPEMFDTGFSFNVERTADESGTTLAFLGEQARHFRCWFIAGRTVRAPKDAREGAGDNSERPRGINRASVIDPEGSEVCTYDKIHLFSPGGEPERFVPGQEARVFDWPGNPEAGRAADPGRPAKRGLRVQPTICYDLRFPELFRAGLLMGAELIVVIANWPAGREAQRRAMLVSRAIENQAFVVGVNRVGRDPKLEYAGGSIVLSPKGEELAEAGTSECVLSCELDPGVVARWRAAFSAWKDHRMLPHPRS